MSSKHEILEKNVGLLAIAMVLAVSIGGLTQIVPLFFQDVVNEPVKGMKPYTALQLEGRRRHHRRPGRQGPGAAYRAESRRTAGGRHRRPGERCQ